MAVFLCSSLEIELGTMLFNTDWHNRAVIQNHCNKSDASFKTEKKKKKAAPGKSPKHFSFDAQICLASLTA